MPAAQCAPAKTVTLADIGGRYQSMHVVNQDHYMLVEDSPGTYELTEDSIELIGGGKGPLETPDWDQDNLATARKALSDLAVLGFDASYAFGSPEQTRMVPIRCTSAAATTGV